MACTLIFFMQKAIKSGYRKAYAKDTTEYTEINNYTSCNYPGQDLLCSHSYSESFVHYQLGGSTEIRRYLAEDQPVYGVGVSHLDRP